jgi:hypothetical protein
MKRTLQGGKGEKIMIFGDITKIKTYGGITRSRINFKGVLSKS